MLTWGYTMKKGINTLFYLEKKEDLSLVYWLRWQQIIRVRYAFPARQKKEDFSRITMWYLWIGPLSPSAGLATIYICNGKWFDFTKKWYEKDRTWKSETGLERMQKTTGQTASMAHSENMVSRLSTHRKKHLQFLLKKWSRKMKHTIFYILEKSDCAIK